MDFATPSKLSDLTSALSGVKPTLVPASLLRFPPSSNPTTLPPPSDHPTLAHPFTISTDVYNALLSPTVPITIALVYASVISYFNTVNSRRNHKPWAFSQTKLFKSLVILHNAILAVYSAWTFVGMVNAVALSFPGWRGEYGLAGAVDSLCKINGPRGLGSAATYNETTSAWQMTNRAFHLAADGLAPETTDVGRMWNEGLAFYGWLFYLSKFYEVIDTAIILAKGKKSSFLQTYHHAGAMMCMWAGIRYMSPPIWMFVLVNSGIHAIMYSFYLCTVVGISVPKRLKRILTTMQITQFVVGASYAFAHLFVAYRVPVSVPYLYHLGSVASSVASKARSDASSITSSVAVTASADTGAWLKKFALRAAGREALAENVINDRGQKFGLDAVHIVQDFVSREETRFRDELQWIHCLDTSGQVFAILLNCMYLAPLTWLFVRFFITAYLKRVERRRSSTSSEKAQAARQSFQDASKGFSRKVTDVIGEMHGVAEDESESATDVQNVSKPATDAETPAIGEQIQEKIGHVTKAAQDTLREGVARLNRSRGESDGGNPSAYLQNKSTEPWQNPSPISSDTNEEPTADSPVVPEEQQPKADLEESKDDMSRDASGEESQEGAVDHGEDVKHGTRSVGEKAEATIQSVIETGAAVADQVAKTTTSAAVSAKEAMGLTASGTDDTKTSTTATEEQEAGQDSPEESSEVDAVSAPNEDGTGADEGSSLRSPNTDMKDEPSSRDVASTTDDAASETESLPEAKTPPKLTSQKSRPADIRPTTPDKDMAKRLLALRKASFETRMMNSRGSAGNGADSEPRTNESSLHTIPSYENLVEPEAATDTGKSAHDESVESSPVESGSVTDDKNETEVQAPLPVQNEQEEPLESIAEENVAEERAGTEAPTEASAAESLQETTEDNPEQSFETDEVSSGQDSDKVADEPPGQVDSIARDDAEPTDRLSSPPQEDDGDSESEEEAEHMSFIEPEKATDAETMSSAETQKEQAEVSEEQPAVESDGNLATEENIDAESSETKAVAQPEVRKEPPLSTKAEDGSEEATASNEDTTTTIVAPEGASEATEDATEATEATTATTPQTQPTTENDQGTDNPEPPTSELSESKPAVPSQQEETSPPGPADDKVVEHEKPKANGESKTETEPPLIHVDEEPESSRVSTPASAPKAASTKSKTPSLKSKSSQSLKSRSSLSLKSQHEEEEEDKENQAPGSSVEANVEGEEISKVRDDTTFAEAVKE